MASQVICECGYVMRDDDEDRVVALVRDHIRTDHPELLDMATPETIRTWIEIIPPSRRSSARRPESADRSCASRARPSTEAESLACPRRRLLLSACESNGIRTPQSVR